MPISPQMSKKVFIVFSLILGHKHRQRKHKRSQRKLFAGDMLAAVDSLSESFSADASSAKQNKQWSNDSSPSGPHRRSKRFLSYRHFVEVMLVADSKMLAHHGSNLQYYILTLMSIVSVARKFCVKFQTVTGQLGATLLNSFVNFSQRDHRSSDACNE